MGLLIQACLRAAARQPWFVDDVGGCFVVMPLAMSDRSAGFDPRQSLVPKPLARGHANDRRVRIVLALQPSAQNG